VLIIFNRRDQSAACSLVKVTQILFGLFNSLLSRWPTDFVLWLARTQVPVMHCLGERIVIYFRSHYTYCLTHLHPAGHTWSPLLS